VKAGYGSGLSSKFRIFRGSKGESSICIRIKFKVQELYRLKMEPWRAEDSQNGGVAAKIGGLEGL
jgi:hypothetical protein